MKPVIIWSDSPPENALVIRALRLHEALQKGVDINQFIDLYSEDADQIDELFDALGISRQQRAKMKGSHLYFIEHNGNVTDKDKQVIGSIYLANDIKGA